MNMYSYILFNTYKIIPFFITLILCIVSISSIMPIGFEVITPLLGVISLSFWIVYKPDLMGWMPTLAIGIINDALYGSMLGISCLAAIVIRIVIIKLLYNRDSINVTITFLCIGLSLIIWLIINSVLGYILYSGFYIYYNLIFQFLISLVISPIIVFLQLFILKKMFI